MKHDIVAALDEFIAAYGIDAKSTDHGKGCVTLRFIETGAMKYWLLRRLNQSGSGTPLPSAELLRDRPLPSSASSVTRAASGSHGGLNLANREPASIHDGSLAQLGSHGNQSLSEASGSAQSAAKKDTSIDSEAVTHAREKVLQLLDRAFFGRTDAAAADLWEKSTIAVNALVAASYAHGHAEGAQEIEKLKALNDDLGTLANANLLRRAEAAEAQLAAALAEHETLQKEINLLKTAIWPTWADHSAQPSAESIAKVAQAHREDSLAVDDSGHDDTDYDAGAIGAKSRSQVQAQSQQLTRLRDGLKTFGLHQSRCRVFITATDGLGHVSHPFTCSCGLDALLAETTP